MDPIPFKKTTITTMTEREIINGLEVVFVGAK